MIAAIALSLYDTLGYILLWLVHVGGEAQTAKELGEVEYKSEGAVIIKYTLSQSHHCSHNITK